MNRFSSILTFLLFSATALVNTSCQTADPLEANNASSQGADTTSVQATQESLVTAEATPVTVNDVSSSILETHQIRVTKTLLEAAPVGGEVRYQIQVHALEDVGTVRMTESIPDGIEFKSATPGAKRSGKEVTWRVPSITRVQTI